MLAFDLLLLGFTLIGHFAACVWLFNRMHAQHLPRNLVYLFDRFLAGGTIVILLLYVLRGLNRQPFIGNGEPIIGFQWLCVGHAIFGSLVCLLAIPLWIWPRLIYRQPAALLSDDFRMVDLAKRLKGMPVTGLKARICAAIPGNQLAQLAIHQKELQLAAWPQALDGLQIVHLTDLHMTGKLSLPFYEAAIEEAAALKPDLFVISGDILENERCLPWIVPTLGKLRAPLGQYFVFGNHELRLPDVAKLEQALVAAGWQNLAGKTIELSYNHQTFKLTGNARPWFGNEPMVDVADNQETSLPHILLAHTPDLFPWAQQRQFQLMLAGHTHGGQIRFPLIGPLISPSVYGFRYASGVFHEGPTVMHVGRGLAGEHPIRLNCPPEITKLVLRSANSNKR